MFVYVMVLLIVSVHSYEVNSGSDVVAGEKALMDVNLLKNFAECLLDEAPCNEFGEKVKKDLPGALVNGCDGCTPQHKHLINVFDHAYSSILPEQYAQVMKKFDPEHIYFPKLLALVKNY